MGDRRKIESLIIDLGKVMDGRAICISEIGQAFGIFLGTLCSQYKDRNAQEVAKESFADAVDVAVRHPLSFVTSVETGKREDSYV